jgi:hypothetical protein
MPTTYEQGSSEARRLVTLSDRVASSSLPLVMSAAEASGIGARLLQDAWVMREQASFALPPSLLGARSHRRGSALRRRPGAAAAPCHHRGYRCAPRRGGCHRSLAVRDAGRFGSFGEDPGGVASAGPPLVVLLDLPLLSDDQNPNAPFAAAFADPWPGTVQIYKDYALKPCASPHRRRHARAKPRRFLERAGLTAGTAMPIFTSNSIAARSLRPPTRKSLPGPMRSRCRTRMAIGKSSSSPMPTSRPRMRGV